MTPEQVSKIVEDIDGSVYIAGSDNRTWTAHYQESDSFLVPGGIINVAFDSRTGVTDKSVHRPGIAEIWNHWKRKLGL
jgi:hypothetical protein